MPLENFRIIKPSQALQPYVSHFWSLKAAVGMDAGDRIIPTGSVSLVFHRGDLMMSLTGHTHQPEAFVSGISTGYADLQATGALDMLVAVFKPLGCAVFFNIPINEFRNSDIPVRDTEDGGLRELTYRVLTERSDDEAVALIERFLMSRLYRNFDNYTHKRLTAAVNAIEADPEINVAAAASESCLGVKQFTRLFSSMVGTRPKEFMRIIRFQRALYTLQTDPKTNFAQLAAGCGYYDQAHMIKEFRQFSGYSPSEYLAVCTPYSDYFTAV